MPHLFCDGEHGLMPCEKGGKTMARNCAMCAWCVVCVSVCAQPIQPHLRRVSRPPRSRTFPNHPPGAAQRPFIHRRTQANRKKRPRQCRDRLETQEKDRDEAAASRGQDRRGHERYSPPFLSCSIYQAIHMIVARREFVMVRKKYQIFGFNSAGYVAHV